MRGREQESERGVTGKMGRDALGDADACMRARFRVRPPLHAGGARMQDPSPPAPLPIRGPGGFIHTYILHIRTYALIYTYIHTYIHVYTYVYIRMYAYTYIRMYIHIHTYRRRLGVDGRAGLYIHTNYICARTRLYIHTYIHTCMLLRTYVRTYIYTHIDGG